MTNTAKHTPTPWFTEHSGVQKIYAQGAGDIAHVFANCLMGDCKANAAFIVKAVNCHDKLVEPYARILEAAKQHLDTMQRVPVSHRSDTAKLAMKLLIEDITKAEAALAAAEA